MGAPNGECTSTIAVSSQYRFKELVVVVNRQNVGGLGELAEWQLALRMLLREATTTVRNSAASTRVLSSFFSHHYPSTSLTWARYEQHRARNADAALTWPESSKWIHFPLARPHKSLSAPRDSELIFCGLRLTTRSVGVGNQLRGTGGTCDTGKGL